MKELSVLKAKRFLKALSSSYSKFDSRNQARKELKAHIRRLHRIASGKTKAKMTEELSELEFKLDHVIRKEKELTSIETAQEREIKELTQEVFDLRLKHDEHIAEIQSLREQLKDYHKIKLSHQRKMTALEAKVKTRIKADEMNAKQLDVRLKKMDEIYDKLISQGVSSAELKKIQKRIRDIKNRVKELQESKVLKRKKASSPKKKRTPVPIKKVKISRSKIQVSVSKKKKSVKVRKPKITRTKTVTLTEKIEQ